MSEPNAAEKAKMALAELGYPNADVVMDQRPGFEGAIRLNGGFPEHVWWLLNVTVFPGDPIPCWGCWKESRFNYTRAPAAECTSGNCSQPNGRTRPPRELVVAS